MQLQETKAISEAAYVEKERLNELVKLLEERYTFITDLQSFMHKYQNHFRQSIQDWTK